MPDLRTKRTHRAIVTAFRQLLTTTPFDKVTINDIAESALINRSTFYVHFLDKYDLLQHIFEDVLIQEQIDTSHIDQHPFELFARVKSSSIEAIIKRQTTDESFVTEFFKFFIEKQIERNRKMTELERCFFIGRVRTIMMWIQRTPQTFNIFTDYPTLDRIFQTGKASVAVDS
ncbi:TetR/AcrR family transcriptional regulator [Levilactobacillus brevis]|uniref:TetR/AcrR family transcriptional regulator n=1 Tax=Levilactobacillus brevis TaxID=1580 RepID=UPI000572F646|nr:TetR family transcriptional regulator [Levilactobacillus brevis]AJA80869.1 hypothetical protein L747_04980 [Levilactobacillus brevis BSO 464]